LTTPAGKVGGVTASAASTLIEIDPDTTELPCESVIFAVKVKVPGTAVGEIVPLTLPVLLRLKPVGRPPELIVQLIGPTPPVSVKAVDTYAAPASPVVGKDPAAVVIVRIPLIVMVRLPVAVWLGVAESVTVTVKLNVPAAVGEPEIVPEPLKVRPVGREPEVTAQV
jgi:hypothetical protein